MQKARHLKSVKFSEPSEIIKHASKYLTGIQLKLFASQIRLGKVKKNGRRYTKTDASFALSPHQKSPKAYRYMSKIFALPAVRTLRSWLHNFEFHTGWNDCIFKQLKEKAETMDEKDRVCVLMFDAIAIKSGFYYNNSKDKIEGTEDLGIYGKSDKVAKYAMVFMVRGLAHKWKHILGYFLFNSSIKPDTLKNIILSSLTKLQEANLIPKVVICDQDVTNRSVFSKLDIFPISPGIIHNGEDIYFMYDSPHLLKSVRNNFMKYNISIDNDTAKWHYIRSFYEKDKKMSIRLAPRLTDKHIYCNTFDKMRVCMATQVFSRTVAAGIDTHSSLGSLPEDAAATAAFINKMDMLFDLFNSNNINHYKSSKCAFTEYSLEQLSDLDNWIRSWKVLGGQTSLPCVEGWKLNISSLKRLWSDLSTKYGYKFILTNRLNQDCLENFFSSVRNSGGNNESPTAPQFMNLIKNLITNNIMQQGGGGNCATDSTPMLNILDIRSTRKKHSPIRDGAIDILEKSDTHLKGENYPQNTDSNISIADYFSNFNPLCDNNGLCDNNDEIDQTHEKETKPTTSYIEQEDILFSNDEVIGSPSLNNNISLEEYFSTFNPYTSNHETCHSDNNLMIHDNALTYIAGYMGYKLKKLHNCDICKDKAIEKYIESSNHNKFLMGKGGDRPELLCSPTNCFIELVRQYEYEFQKNINTVFFQDKVKFKLCKKRNESVKGILTLCSDVQEKLMNTYVNMRLHYHIKFLNRDIRGKRSCTNEVYTTKHGSTRKLGKISHL